MRRLSTKEGRLAVQNAAFQRLLDKGYNHEIYKGLNIFYKEDQGKFYVDIFRDGSSKAITGNYYYRNIEQINQIINNAKKSYDRNLTYKAEQKAKGGYQTGAAMASAQIKAELKQVFPDIKFSVTSSNFAGGDSVDIRWTDGPAYDLVNDITSKYQYGNFNGMEDIYEYSNSRDDIHQAKYVHAQRSMSSEVRGVLEPIAKEKWSDGYRSEDVLYRIFRKTSIPIGAKVTGIEWIEGVTSGSTEDCYQIVYDGPKDQQEIAVSQEQPEYEKVEVAAGEVQIVDYSEKAIAVIGDTKPIKEKLMELGGKFNRNLSCGPGWIFSKKRLELVQNSLLTIANV